jgi:hypothetical protein
LAGSVSLALALTRCRSPGSSEKLSDRSRAVLQGDPAFIEHSVPQFGAVLFPLSTTMMSRPLAVISKVFHLPPAFGIGLIST